MSLPRSTTGPLNSCDTMFHMTTADTPRLRIRGIRSGLLADPLAQRLRICYKLSGIRHRRRKPTAKQSLWLIKQRNVQTGEVVQGRCQFWWKHQSNPFRKHSEVMRDRGRSLLLAPVYRLQRLFDGQMGHRNRMRLQPALEQEIGSIRIALGLCPPRRRRQLSMRHQIGSVDTIGKRRRGPRPRPRIGCHQRRLLKAAG